MSDPRPAALCDLCPPALQVPALWVYRVPDEDDGVWRVMAGATFRLCRRHYQPIADDLNRKDQERRDRRLRGY